MPAGQFDKDFGYLMPFLDKVAGAAAGMSDSSARAELTRLIADEKRRWTRIRQLLEGSPASRESTGSNAAEAAQSSQTRPAFTVGSLRPKRD